MQLGILCFGTNVKKNNNLRMDLLLVLQLKIKLHQFTTKEHLLILLIIHGIKELKIAFSDFLSFIFSI